MNNKYDCIVIGGGHNGLVNAAYLARAGRRVLVLERRHVLGGAAVTEEIYPGFKYSVASYVVSLLRPEIIRELDLPRHGLEILPLDGTFTPMPNGDHLWRVNDHTKTVRDSPALPRGRRSVRRILEDDGSDVPVREAHPVHDSARPDNAQSARPQAVSFLVAALPRTFFRRALHAGATHDHELSRFSRPRVRDRCSESHYVRVGNHRDVPGDSLAGHCLCSAASLYGRN